MHFCKGPFLIRILQEAPTPLSSLSQFTYVGFLFKSSSVGVCIVSHDHINLIYCKPSAFSWYQQIQIELAVL